MINSNSTEPVADNVEDLATSRAPTAGLNVTATPPASNTINYDVVEVDINTQDKVDAWNRLREEHLNIKDGFTQMKLPHAGMDWAHVSLATEDTTVRGLIGPPPHYAPSLFLCVASKTHIKALPIEEWADPQMDSILAFVVMSRMPGADGKVALLVPMGLVKTARGYNVSVRDATNNAGNTFLRRKTFVTNFKASMGREFEGARRFFSEKDADQIDEAIDTTLELGGQHLSLPSRVSENRGALGVQNAMFAAALNKYKVPIVTRFACQFAGAGDGHVGVTLNPPVRRVAEGIGPCLLGYSEYTPRQDQIDGKTRSGRPKRLEHEKKRKGAFLSEPDRKYLQSLYTHEAPTVHANLRDDKLCIKGFADVPLRTPLLNIVYEPNMANNLGVLLTVLPSE